MRASELHVEARGHHTAKVSSGQFYATAKANIWGLCLASGRRTEGSLEKSCMLWGEHRDVWPVNGKREHLCARRVVPTDGGVGPA